MLRVGQSASESPPAPAFLPAHQFHKPFDHLVDRQAVGRHIHRVGRSCQGADLARGVAVVPGLLRFEHLLQRRRFALAAEIAEPPSGTLLGTGREEDLALGAGERHGALVATFGHDVAPAGHGLLPCDQLRANLGIARRVSGHGGNFLRADRPADVFAVQQDAVVGKFDRQPGGQVGQRLGPVPVQSCDRRPAKATARYMAPVSRY